jgi:hypothetical protein
VRLNDHVAEIDADPKPNALFLRNFQLAVSHDAGYAFGSQRIGLSRQAKVLDLKIAGPMPRMRSEGPSRRFGQVGRQSG